MSAMNEIFAQVDTDGEVLG